MSDDHPMSLRPLLTDEHGLYRQTLDGLLEGFQIIGYDWTYLYVNPAAALHGRLTPEELIGRRMQEVYRGIEQTPLFAVLRTCMHGRSAASFDNHFTYPDGTSRWFELRVEPVPQGLCIYSADIQARKDTEAACERTVAELRSALAERTAELETMRARLQVLER